LEPRPRLTAFSASGSGAEIHEREEFIIEASDLLRERPRLETVFERLASISGRSKRNPRTACEAGFAVLGSQVS
jgi:hypothetical protein